MDKITDTFNHHSKTAYHSVIQAAMKHAATKLNKYYGYTDCSSTYQIAMGSSLRTIFMACVNETLVLHPALKLEYFQTHHWKTEWIEVAEDLVCEDKKNYEIKDQEDNEQDNHVKKVLIVHCSL
jgi:hypothetical protein